MLKKVVIILFFFLLFAELAIGNDLRNVTSLQFETYSYNGYSWYIEDTFLVKVSKDQTILIKGFHKQREDLSSSDSVTSLNLDGTIGTVINFGLVYSEFSYTILSDLDNNLSHSLYFDLTKEGPEFLFSPGMKILYDDNDIILIPSFGYKHYGNSIFQIGGKLFGSFNLGVSNNAAIWVEGTYSPQIPLAYRLGFATGTLYTESDKDLNLEFSLLPGLDFKINDKTKLKYNFKWNIRQNSYETLGHELVFDIKF